MLAGGEVVETDDFEGVGGFVGDTFGSVYFGVGALAEFGFDLEVFGGHGE